MIGFSLMFLGTVVLPAAGLAEVLVVFAADAPSPPEAEGASAGSGG